VALVLFAVGLYFLLPTALLLLFSTGGWAALPLASADQQIFKDVFQTVLALAALSIAAFGFGTYKILSAQIEEKVRRNTDMQYRLTIAYHKASLAFVYWRLYANAEPRSPTSKIYLDVAIDQTRRAYEEHVANADQDDPSVEHLVCEIRNNLAFYISERHTNFGSVNPEEQAECLSLVDWLEGRIQKFPQRAYDYRDTIDTVRERLSSSDSTAG